MSKFIRLPDPIFTDIGWLFINILYTLFIFPVLTALVVFYFDLATVEHCIKTLKISLNVHHFATSELVCVYSS